MSRLFWASQNWDRIQGLCFASSVHGDPLRLERVHGGP
jgi:hypothetical protein